MYGEFCQKEFEYLIVIIFSKKNNYKFYLINLNSITEFIS